ncbi:MAG: hypothetical protein ACKPE3_02265, partial [Sphaerospermopsis kisseleviana]
MPKTTPKSKLETAQEKLQQVANKNTPQAVNVSSQSPQSPHTSATFNPSDYTASDLFKDSSSLPRTAKKDADQVIQ